MAASGGRSAVMDAAALDQLRTRFRGELLRPGQEDYERARAIWNGAIDRRPALIARCTGVADVIAAVTWARAGDLLVAVRGGGHNVAGTAVCDDGLVVDLSPMKGMRVDPATQTARLALGRVRPRDAGLRLGRPRRHRHPHGHRRTDAGRRHRLAHAQAWPHLRQPSLGGSRHRRRRIPIFYECYRCGIFLTTANRGLSSFSVRKSG